MTPIWRFNVTLAILTLPLMGQGQGIACNGEESNGNFSLSVELFAENIGEIADFQGNVTDLTGYNTYRIYLNTEGPLDKLSAVYGDDRQHHSGYSWLLGSGRRQLQP